MPDAIFKRKMLYRAHHRGIREMDVILGRYCSKHIECFSAQQCEALGVILNMSDLPLYQALSEDGQELENLATQFPSPIRNEALKMLKDIQQAIDNESLASENWV